MTPEERKIYNEKYYAEHKKDITEKLLIKIECPKAVHYSRLKTERSKTVLNLPFLTKTGFDQPSLYRNQR
jgi:hypothetical protein